MSELFAPLMAGLWLAWIVSWHLAALWRGGKREEVPRRAYRVHSVLGFTLKARVEERFIEASLPDYADYRRRVGMIVPGIAR